MSDWGDLFYEWFLEELLKALRDRAEPPLRTERLIAPRVDGQISTVGARSAATGRQSNLNARPGTALITAARPGDGFGLRALGDTNRSRPQLRVPPGFVPVRLREFTDVLLPLSLPALGAHRFFRSYASSPFHVPDEWKDGEHKPALPSMFFLPFDDGLVWTLPFQEVPAYGAGLGWRPIVDFGGITEGQYAWLGTLRSAIDVNVTYGFHPLPSYLGATLSTAWGANDALWPFAAQHERRPNALFPWMTGVDGQGPFVRVLDGVASTRRNPFTYLNGADEWAFPAFDYDAISVLFAGKEFSAELREMSYAYVGGSAPSGLIAPTDIETIFMEFPILSSEWEEGFDSVIEQAFWYVDEYTINPAFTAGRILGIYPAAGVRDAVEVEDGTAAFTFQPIINERLEFGPIVDRVADLAQTDVTMGTRKVRMNGTHSVGAGEARVRRFTVPDVGEGDPEPPAFFSTPERRVIDRVVLCWMIRPEMSVGASPGTEPGETRYFGIWDLAPAPHGGYGAALVYTEHPIDWGICFQEYRVVIRRFENRVPFSDSSVFDRQLFLVLQRVNRGGDYIRERGMSNWGRLLTGQTWCRTQVRLRLPGLLGDPGFEEEPVPPYGSKWWEDYSQSDWFLHSWLDFPSYFNFSPGTSFVAALIDSRHTDYVLAGIEWHNPDYYNEAGGGEVLSWEELRDFAPFTGRWMSKYGGPSGQAYPEVPSLVAFDDERADIWYDVGTFRLGRRTAYEDGQIDYFSEQTTPAGGEIQVIIDDAGNPVFDIETSAPAVNEADKAIDVSYPNVADIIQRFVTGANLYEGPFGILPVSLAAAPRYETFCGLLMNAADHEAVDVVTAPGGGHLCLAVKRDWSWRVSRSSDDGEWALVDQGEDFETLLIGSDAGLLDRATFPVQEHRFAMDGWPTPIGVIRTSRQAFAFRAPGLADHAREDLRPVLVRWAGGVIEVEE